MLLILKGHACLYWSYSLNTVQTVLHLEVLYLIIDSLNTVQIALHLEVLYLIIDSLNTVQTVLHLEVLYLITDSLNTVQTVLHLEFLFRLLTASNHERTSKYRAVCTESNLSIIRKGLLYVGQFVLYLTVSNQKRISKCRFRLLTA
jgi:acyl carrier protein